VNSSSNNEDILESIDKAIIEERIFSDLKIIVFWIIISVILFYVPVLNTSIIRIIFALPITLFIPGYILLTVLYPQKDDLDLIERIALSIGLSLAIVPLIGFGLNYTSMGIQLHSLILVICCFTLVMVFIAQYRRGNLPDCERYEFPFKQILIGLKEEFVSKDKSRIDRIISIILLISIISSVMIIVFVTLFPKEGEKFSEFYILGKNKIFDDYPHTIFLGHQNLVYLGINNYENRNITYTIEPYLVKVMENNLTQIPVMSVIQPLLPIKVWVPRNETIITPYNIDPSETESNLVVFLLFNEF